MRDIAIAQQPELIVCSIDYDGCVSGYVAGDGARNMHIHLRDLLIRYPQVNLVLMVGSARQSIVSDLHHERANENGSCWVFLKSFLEHFKLSWPNLADRISLDPFLLEDIFREKNPGYHFNLRVDSFSEVLESEYAKRASTFKNGIDIDWQDLTKKSMIYAQMHYIGTKYSGKNIAFHFYDDRVCILEALQGLYGIRMELIPNNFSLRLFNYAAGGFKGNASLDIDGVGFVDNDYLNSVKKLHSADWLRLHHANTIDRVLNEPCLALAIHLYGSSSDKNAFIRRLREKWGSSVFDFLDRLCIQRSEKMMIAGTWLPEAVSTKNVEFVGRCVLYVHPNQCVEYFIEALEKNDNELAAAFAPILDSPYLGEFSRNDINISLFSKKKYDWLKKQYGNGDDAALLIEWCRDTDSDGLKKSGLKNLLNKHFIDYRKLPLVVQLDRFCYHLCSLQGDELTAEDRVALYVIVQPYALDSHCVEERLLSTVILSHLSINLADIPQDSEKIKQKYLQASAVDYPSEVQKIMIEKIQLQCLNQMSDELLIAYRALRFVILAVSLPSDGALVALYQVVTYWKNAESIVPGKTHLQLLIEKDRDMQIAAASRPRSAFSFFCCCCDKNSVATHEEFLDTLPIVAMKNAASKTERQVRSEYTPLH